jgi:hypothetical protein
VQCFLREFAQYLDASSAVVTEAAASVHRSRTWQYILGSINGTACNGSAGSCRIL